MSQVRRYSVGLELGYIEFGGKTVPLSVIHILRLQLGRGGLYSHLPRVCKGVRAVRNVEMA